MPAVGHVDRLAVLDALRDHEARVEDRHGQDHEREHQGDHRVRLQGALHGDRREHVAEQVRARVAEEDRGGVKPVAQVAERGARGQHREHAGRVAVERQRDHGERDARDRADAGGQAVDAVDEVDHVHHGDDADHRERIGGRAEVEVAEERQRHRLDPHAARDRDHGGEDLARQASRRRRGRAGRPRPRPRRSPRRRSGCRASAGRAAGTTSPAARIPARIASPPSRGVGNWCRPALARLVDRADPPGEGLHDRRRDPDDHEREREREECVGQVRHRGVGYYSSRRGRVFRPDTVALVPQREGEQAPELAAQVLAAGRRARRSAR